MFTLSALTLALTACGGNGSSGESAEAQDNNQPGTLSITGQLEYGSTLSANLDDPDGLSNPDNIEYQWQRNDSNITGATNKNYQIQADDLNKPISVTVNYVDDKGLSSSLKSAQTTNIPLVNLEGSIAIEGNAKQGQTLKAILTDENGGLDKASPTFVWFADGEIIPNENTNSLTLERAQVAKNISVQANYTDGHGYSENPTSEATLAIEKIANSEGVLSITDSSGNTPNWKVGNQLTANLTDLNTITSTVSYYWYLDDELIFEQNQATYTIQKADIGKTLSVKVEYADADGYSESVLFQSNETITSNSLVENGQNYPVGAKKAGNEPIDRAPPVSYESFEYGGWNAGTQLSQYNPGLDSSIPKQFRFTQFQGPHSFTAETNITRFGNYSAKLHWQHGDPGKWNGDPDKIDNVDRKAMFHGRNANSITSTTWYGFSIYFPSDGSELIDGEDPLIFQLHGAPDKDGDKKEPGRNPPVALTVANDGFYMGYGWDTRKFATSLSGEGRGKVHVPLNLADYKDRWVDFVIQVRANPFEETGFIKMWIDGEQMLNTTDIQIGYNDDKGLYPSWGWYITGDRAANRDKDAIMYYDEIRHVEADDATYYDVAPGYFAK